MASIPEENAAVKQPKKNKKKGNVTVIDNVKNTVKNINKKTVTDFAKKNAKVLIAVGSTLAVLAVAGIAAKSKKNKK